MRSVAHLFACTPSAGIVVASGTGKSGNESTGTLMHESHGRDGAPYGPGKGPMRPVTPPSGPLELSPAPQSSEPRGSIRATRQTRIPCSTDARDRTVRGRMVLDPQLSSDWSAAGAEESRSSTLAKAYACKCTWDRKGRVGRHKHVVILTWSVLRRGQVRYVWPGCPQYRQWRRSCLSGPCSSGLRGQARSGLETKEPSRCKRPPAHASAWFTEPRMAGCIGQWKEE